MNKVHPKFDKHKLLNLIRTNYDFAERTFALILASDWNIGDVCGFWTIKDPVAHLMWWEEITLKWLEDAENGKALWIPLEGYSWDQFDEINAFYYDCYKGVVKNEIVDKFHAIQKQVLMKVESYTDGELAGGGRFEGMFIDSPADVIYVRACEHYEMHLAQIREWWMKQQNTS